MLGLFTFIFLVFGLALLERWYPIRWCYQETTSIIGEYIWLFYVRFVCCDDFFLWWMLFLFFCPIKRHIENAYGVGKQNGLFFFLQMNCNKLVMLTILSNYVIRVFFTFCLVLKPLAVVGF